MSEYFVLMKDDKNNNQPIVLIEADGVLLSDKNKYIKFCKNGFDAVAVFNLDEIKGFYKVRGVLDV